MPASDVERLLAGERGPIAFGAGARAGRTPR
jgi:hypothetical protein